MDKFEWIKGEREELGESDIMVFPLVLHPDTSGMAHVIGMIERFLRWVGSSEGEVEFGTFGSVAEEWKGKNAV